MNATWTNRRDEIEKQLKGYLGNSFGLLARDPTSLIIAYSLIAEYEWIESIRHSDNKADYDYSGVTLKLAKIVEREINNGLFFGWQLKYFLKKRGMNKSYLEQISQTREPNNTESFLAGYLSSSLVEPKHKPKHKKPRPWLSLNKMQKILSVHPKSPSDSPLHKSLLDYVTTSLHDGVWLISKEFTETLKDIAQYRNTGAHADVISRLTCSNIYGKIFVGPEPWLKKLLEALQEKKDSPGVVFPDNQLEKLIREKLNNFKLPLTRKDLSKLDQLEVPSPNQSAS